jgi:hypothetical protein
MSTDIDWQRELDTSFSSGRDVPPGHYVAAGRRAVRRRRATAAAMIVATVALGGGAVWAGGSDSTLRGDAPVATEGVAPREDRTTDGQRERDRDRSRPRSAPSMSVEEEFLGEPAVIEPDGTVKLSPLTDAELERVPNPMGYTSDQGHSVGLRVIYQGVEKYTLAVTNHDGTASSMHTNSASGDFPGWLAGKVELQRGLDAANADSPDATVETPDTWLTLGADGSVVPATPFVSVTVSREVDLGGGFALGADRTGVARLQVAGLPEFVAWRVVDDELEVIYGGGRFESLDAFVRWARQQYASGEGLR